MKATKITQYTLVGYGGGKYPISGYGGNCFSVAIEGDEREYRIVNFGMENLKQLVRQGEVSWPIEIEPLDERRAVVTDARIPKDWYAEHYCFICTPKSLFRPQDFKEFYNRYEKIKDENGKALYLPDRPRSQENDK